MSTNNLLRDLHFRRIERLTGEKPKVSVSTQTEPNEFCCAVCYTSGETSGIVKPVCCSHKICLSCYTNIVILHKDKSKCPECRALYMANSSSVGIEDVDYSDMPPLIPSTYIYQYIVDNNIIDNLLLISHIDNQIRN